jgi:divinyl chlorophyllide a 8-vinyl-reductase
MRVVSCCLALCSYTLLLSNVAAFSPLPRFQWGSSSAVTTPTKSTQLQETSVNGEKVNGDVNNGEGYSKGTAIICGATGYIGKSVVRESVRQGYHTVALVRDPLKAQKEAMLAGATIVQCDVTDAAQVRDVMAQIKATCPASSNGEIAAIVSCLASRSGVKKDAYLIDYQATLNCLEAGRAISARHFVLLSAFCVKNPWLQFQQAKLQFEAALQAQTDMTYTIVRPTAFFKSVSGQLEVVQSGAPFVMFGDGEVTRCNPIAESDLATYMLDSISDPNRRNKVINLGGPDDPITMKEQGRMLFAATGKEPKYAYAPLWLFDVIINGLQFLANLTGSEALEDAAETGRIGKYYAVEDMLTTDPNEKYGTITLQEHYNRIAVEGNDYDPYTTMFARARGVDVDAIQKEMKDNAATMAATK